MTVEEQREIQKRLCAAGEIEKKITRTENLQDIIKDSINGKAILAIEVDDGKHSYCLSGEDVFDDLKYPILCLLQMRIDSLNIELKRI